MAFHIAADYARSGDERLTRAEADEILGLTPDAAPGPAQIAEDRQALQTLMRALERMPERQREILLAARLDVTQRSWRRGMAFRYAWWSASCSTRRPIAARACRIQGRIDDFQPLLQIGRQGAGQRGRGLGAAHPVRAGHAARRAGVAGMVRAQRRTRRRSSGRGAPGWTSDRPAGRSAPRIRARRRRAGAAGAPGAARGPGRGGAAAAAALPPLGWWASLEGLGADYSTAVGEQRTVDWDGGQAVVELDARTRMNVADGPRRLELLEGQAAITCAEQGQA